MNRPLPIPPNRVALALVAGLMLVGGCAGLPRIDPTGERLLVWPGETTPPAIVGGATFAAPTPVAAPLIQPTPVPQLGNAPLGNVPVAPVYSTPSANPFAAPTIVGPPVSSATGVPIPIGPPTAMPGLPGPAPIAGRPVPREYVRMLPERVLAPVGSEVILRAGICSKNGWLLANQRVEWALEREGAGQFVDLNDRGILDPFRWPWNTPRKVDPWYSIGATAVTTTTLDRGTPNPADDIPIQRGEAWITVTSPVAGTSHVTAYSPIVDDWQGRRATAIIYWIDAQWVFPPSVTVATGQTHTLTTTVTRRSDGAPLAGYLVRYEVVGAGAASLGYDEGPVTDVPTDALGRASVEVSPTDAAGGAATINVTVLRPPQSGSDAGPELALGRGTVTLNWAAGGVVSPPPALEPTPALPPTSSPGTPFIPPTSSPPATSPPGQFTPPADEPPPGRSQLTVTVRNSGPDQVEVGQLARFEIRVANTGDGIARDVVVRDEFDNGLRVPGRDSQAVESRIRDLAPGDSETQNISFEVGRDGQLCHIVTVSDASGSRAFERACVSGVAPTPVVLPTLAVTVNGPLQQTVGELGVFEIVIRNTGTVAAENVTLVNEFPQGLRAVQATPNYAQQPGGQLSWQIDRVDVGETQRYKVQYEFLAPTRSACVLAETQLEGGGVYVDEHCTEVLPLDDRGPQGGAPQTIPAVPGGQPQPGPLRQSPQTLQLSVVESANPVAAGERMFMRVEITNAGTEPVSEVTLRVAFPAELVPDPVIVNPPVPYRLESAINEVRFDPIGSIRPGETIPFQLPVNVRRAGTVTVWGRLEGPNIPEPIQIESNPIEILPQAL